MKKIVYNILIVLFALVFIFALYKLGSTLWDYHENQELQGGLQEIFHQQNSNSLSETSGEEQEGDESREESHVISIDKTGLEMIYEMNNDTVGWLSVPGMGVDQPVVWKQSDNDYYLYRDFYKKNRSAGTLFLDGYNNPKGENQNLVIYGHRMKDGSMFGNLGYYMSQSFYRNNKTFTYETLEGTYLCEVFAVYRCNTSLNYVQTYFPTEESFNTYVQQCKELAAYNTGITPKYGETLMTFSTCDYEEENGRMVLHARLTLMD